MYNNIVGLKPSLGLVSTKGVVPACRSLDCVSIFAAWVVIVVGEMTGVPTGLGAIIMEARQLSRTEIVICGMIVIGVAGFISDRLVLMLGKRLLRWSPNFA